MGAVTINRPGRRRLLLLSTVLLLGLGVTGFASPAAAAPPEATTAVIVALVPGSDSVAESRRASGRRGAVEHVYRAAVDGFAGEFTEREIAALRRSPRVALIEPDAVATISGTQTGATWGLDRIDQRSRPLNTTYVYPATAGAGVTAYVIDTGIAVNDAEFGARLAPGYADPSFGGVTTDCNGHGTHVAGTLAGGTYGVAKAATLVPVRVLNCAGSGSYSGVIAGLDWAAAQHVGGPAVANLSLGGPISAILDQAVQRLIIDGVSVFVAAGNSNTSACSSSPARVAAAVTVGATDSTDRRASFSNYGSCLDLFAPGVGITSAWHTGATNTISGTSMASPHVAGAAALLLSQNGALTPAAVRTSLVNASTSNVVANRGSNSPNRLLYVAP